MMFAKLRNVQVYFKQGVKLTSVGENCYHNGSLNHYPIRSGAVFGSEETSLKIGENGSGSSGWHGRRMLSDKGGSNHENRATKMGQKGAVGFHRPERLWENLPSWFWCLVAHQF